MKLMALAMIISLVAPAMVASGMPHHGLLLNGEWEFAEGQDGEAPIDGWQRVRVPHRSREFEEEPPTSGWYRTTFRLPQSWLQDDARVVLDLSRVRHYARVYIDGEIVGEHYGMRTPFIVELTHPLKHNADHSLKIFTHNCSGDYAHPTARNLSEAALRALDTRFWYTSAATIGIEGDVWLRRVPRISIEDVYVLPSVREKSLTAHVRVQNFTETDVEARVRVTVAREGNVEFENDLDAATLAPQQALELQMEQPWEDAILWGHPPYGEPVLYMMRVAVSVDGVLRDERVVRFGFREVWAAGNKLLLNGVQLFPWGDHTIPYVHERQWLTRKLHDLAASNVSIIEHHRYDAPQVVYDVADELGMFAVSANFCVGSAAVPANLPPEELEIVLANHRAIAEAWVLRERNHPSILFWSVTDTWAPEYCVPLLRVVREHDLSRITEVTYNNAPPELLELIDTYRLFSGLGQIEAAIEKVRAGDMPVKPVRVGEAGIFAKPSWDYDEEPPMIDGWLEFIRRMPERNIHGLQTFYVSDMDYRGFSKRVPGMLAAPVTPKVTWPSQSGADARIDPFGEGTQQAWGKAALYLNWCDPDEQVSKPTATRKWWHNMHRELTGRDVGSLASHRVPEVIVTVRREGEPVSGAQVFVRGFMQPEYGVTADRQGRAWFVLPEAGSYEFRCEHEGFAGEVKVDAKRQPIDVAPGYDHIEWVTIELDVPGE